MHLDSFGLSDIGLVRQNNEDALIQLPSLKCFILADGMGGHQAGEIASSETVKYLSNYIKSLFADASKKYQISELITLIARGIKETNTHVYNLAEKQRSLQGMGTTLCLALIYDHTLICAHVGDSRIYRLTKEGIEQLTQDHSLRDELFSKNQRDQEWVSILPLKNIITRAIGTHPKVSPEIHTFPVTNHDIYLICSDGLTDEVSDQEIFRITKQSHSMKETVQKLIEKAKIKGGNDNITVIGVKISQ